MKENENATQPDPRQILRDISARESQKQLEALKATGKSADKAQPDGSKADVGSGKSVDAEPKTAGDAAPSLGDILKNRVSEDEQLTGSDITLRNILVGDMLTAGFVKRQIWLIVIITAFIIVYISNRYSCQQSQIKIDDLTKELQDAKFRAMSSNSELTGLSRESKVLEMLRMCSDSTLHIATQPPYIINVPKQDKQ